MLSKEGEDLMQEIQGILEKVEISKNVFLVLKKDSGQRPVINLKKLNEYVQTEHFKMEGIHVLKDLLKAGDYTSRMRTSWY